MLLSGDYITKGDVVHASNHLWCVLCQRWVHYGRTINHYTRHVRTHAEQREEIQQLSDTSGTHWRQSLTFSNEGKHILR
jgi:hypothetical protein